MTGKVKNIRATLSGFLRYRGKEMSNTERNVFERELEKDPFAQEASEGLDLLASDEIKKDLLTLQKQVEARTGINRRLRYYRIAASVAVLIGLSSLFIIIQRNKPEVEISDNVKTDKKPEMPVVNEAKEIAAIPGKKEAEMVKIMAEQPSAIAGAGLEKKAAAGAVSAARNENVNLMKSYNPPLPVNGKENFDKYIEENIRRPANAGPGEMIVVVSFIVRNTGIRDSIKIVSSPGKSFSDEAIRLIKKGPLWKPAEENNIKIDDEVKIRIIFK